MKQGRQKMKRHTAAQWICKPISQISVTLTHPLKNLPDHLHNNHWSSAFKLYLLAKIKQISWRNKNEQNHPSATLLPESILWLIIIKWAKSTLISPSDKNGRALKNWYLSIFSQVTDQFHDSQKGNQQSVILFLQRIPRHTLFKQLKITTSSPLTQEEDIHESGTFQLIFSQDMVNIVTKW